MAYSKSNKDTLLALSVTLIVMGLLFLADKLGLFSKFGYGWVMAKDNLLLITSVIFLIFKREKTVGAVLLGIWIVLNIGTIISFLGQLSGFLLPLVLLIVGIILFIVYKK